MLRVMTTSLLGICCCTTTWAQPPVAYQSPPKLASYNLPPSIGLHGVLQGGISYGGDTLSRAVITTQGYYGYSSTYTRELNAGELWQGGAGLLLRPSKAPVYGTATINYIADSVTEGSVDLSFRRTAIDLMAHAQFDRHVLGLGGTAHRSIRQADKYVSTSNIYTIETTRFAPSRGVIAEWGYYVAPQTQAYVRYTAINYKPEGLTVNGAAQTLVSDVEVDGSNIAIGLRGTF